jgi:hypothetical protein
MLGAISRCCWRESCAELGESTVSAATFEKSAPRSRARWEGWKVTQRLYATSDEYAPPDMYSPDSGPEGVVDPDGCCWPMSLTRLVCLRCWFAQVARFASLVWIARPRPTSGQAHYGNTKSLNWSLSHGEILMDENIPTMSLNVASELRNTAIQYININ